MEIRHELSNGRFCYVTDSGEVFNEKHRKLSIQKDKAGYCSVNMFGKRYLLHRLVYEAFCGDIPNDKQIHHINEDKSDNKLENLVAMTMEQHQHLHKQIYPITKKCEICGKEFTPHKTKRKRAKTCSHECWIIATKNSAAKRKIPIAQMDMDGTIIKIWDSARDIQKNTGYFDSNINKCCNGKIRSCYGYKWKYA